MISLIVAMGKNKVIARDGIIPWYIPDELKWFKKITNGKNVIMGRKTWESLPIKPLPNRTNIILTRDHNKIDRRYREDTSVVIYNDFDNAIAALPKMRENIIIGGAEIYKKAIPICKKMYITTVQVSPYGDTYFPEFEWYRWKTIWTDTSNDLFHIEILERK